MRALLKELPRYAGDDDISSLNTFDGEFIFSLKELPRYAGDDDIMDAIQ